MAKRLINTTTALDLNLEENKSKLSGLSNGELVVQSSKEGELKIWGKTPDGEVVSLPNQEDIKTMIDEAVAPIDLSGYAEIEKLNTINGQSLYSEDGNPVDIIIEVGTIDGELLKDYAKKSYVDDALEEKANKGDVYSKDEIDIKLETKADISYVDEVLESKTDKTDIYTKDEVDIKLNDKANVSYVDEALEEKANKDDVYTKEKVDTRLNSKADKTYVDEALEEKANISDVYTKDKVNTKLESKADKIYVDEALEEKADTSDVYTKKEVNTKLDSKVDKTYVDENLEGKVNKDDVYTKENIDIKLNDKADKTDIYTKEEINEMVSAIPTSEIVVLPESVYEILEKNGEVSYEGVNYVYNASIMYYLYED
jgi:hypothetical protein